MHPSCSAPRTILLLLLRSVDWHFTSYHQISTTLNENDDPSDQVLYSKPISIGAISPLL